MCTGRRADPLWLALFFFAIYSALSVARFRTLSTMSWDLGIFEQAVRSYAHFQAPIVDLKGPGTNILGDHFSPVVAVIAPLYRFFPTPVTLLVAQSFLFASSVVPVTRVAALRLGRRQGLAIGLAYGLSWGLQKAADFDFHEICFAVPLLAFSLEALLRKRLRAAVLWAFPLLLVKEDLGVTAAVIGLLVFLAARGSRRPAQRWAVALMVIGVVGTVALVTVVIPAFNSAGHYDYADKIGSGATIPPGTAVRTLLWTLLPTTGLLALRSPVLAVALPTLAWRFLSHDDHYWSTDWHYSAVLMPIVFMALIDALTTLRHSPPSLLRSFARHLPAAVAAAAMALSTTLPAATLMDAATYRVDERVKAIGRLLEKIPDGATVEANVGPVSELTDRCRVLWMGDTQGIDPNYIALNNGGNWAGDPVAYARSLHPDADYTEIGSAADYVVLRRSP
ncbi:DUF2079 domain-containing protein [Streptomyces sp. NPDC093223]|uniref:DUF2079 domain-containing protein n=1 Tax=Streptomyces sp. NPDC093223 TaxID=3366033 RepID=UPI003816B295